MKDCITHALIDPESETRLEDNEWSTINDLISALQPVKATVEAVCRRDADLFTADVALKFMFSKLEELGSFTSSELVEAMEF